MKLQTKEKKLSEHRRRDGEKRIKRKANMNDVESNKDCSSYETSAMKKQAIQLKKKKKKKEDIRTNESANETHDETHNAESTGQIELDVENKTSKSKEKKRKGKKLKGDRVNKRSREDGSDDDENGKTKKPHSKAKKCIPPREDAEPMENKKVPEEEDVYQISSGDEDNSKGMKKWMTEYHQSRPGLTELQQKIDDFITIHEEEVEKSKKEREAQAEEGGWTVVVHHKGRKKSTESDTGVTVGSVAEAVVIDNITKKKKKEVELDFYRFQRREANRNEILSLQSKFEQDKKQIQLRRAERKFKPY